MLTRTCTENCNNTTNNKTNSPGWNSVFSKV